MVSRCRFLLVLPLLLIVLVSCGGSSGDSDATSVSNGPTTGEAHVEEGEVRVGEPAPTFRLPTMDGRVLDLEEMEGKAVIVNFWATWCGPCRVEMPELQAAYERFHDHGLEIIGVEVASSGNAEQSAEFLQEVGVSFPTYRDENNLMEDQYIKRPALPTTVFIDRQGIVRFVQIGPMTEAFIEEQLDALGF
ncbi:MAG: TlpA family protein disulfide reductase [Chloroflexota bacterium]|nr:TlpA family protein disulfide reductase [Chloroflexota bacterium]